MTSEAKLRNEPQPREGSQPRVPNLLLFNEAKDRINKLTAVMDDLKQVASNNRDLRYTTIDLEAERKAGRLAPDELYIPQHIIDSNIRREQAKYVAYLTSSRRTAIMHSVDNPAMDLALLEMDFTNRTRYDGWQFPFFRGIDGMQQNAYTIFEVVADVQMPGHLKIQDIAYEDFGYPLDTKELQAAEMLTRRYYFTRSQLVALTNPETWAFDSKQVQKILVSRESEINSFKDVSLYPVEKVLFRVNGIVHIGWSCQKLCDDWLRAPRPLYLGRKTLNPVSGVWDEAPEVNYPFFLASYNISENTVIRQYKGRAYLDQDCQEAVSSLISSFVTAHRRAAGLYFARDGEMDPNNDVMEQRNVYFKPGALIDGKVRQFQLNPPDAGMISAIHGLTNMNMQENSQINYAANNRQDSRKTATEIQAAQTEAQLLGTIQLALFSTLIKDIYSLFFQIIKTRIAAGVIKDVMPEVAVMYRQNVSLRPAGDTDVIERQEKILRMQQSWPVIANTPVAPIFLQKLLSLMFPEDAPIYMQALQEDGRKTQMLQSAATVLQGLIEDPQQLSPQAQQHIPALQQLIDQIGQLIQPQQNQQQPQQAQPTQ